jgi:hypothetical protein
MAIFLITFAMALREMETIYMFISVILIPFYVFGLIFLKTKWIFKLIIPLTTSLTFFGIMYLILSIFGDVIFETDARINILFAVVVFFILVVVWEIAYQILKIITNQNNQIKS